MQKKQQTMSAPAPVKRITTTSNAKIALPAMPAMPKMDSAVAPVAMAGMGGTGLGLGMGTGGGGSGGGGGGGGGLSLFGLRENKGGALVGTLFDFKQTPDQRDTPLAKSTGNYIPTDEARAGYKQAVTQYVQGGMNDSSLVSRYFKGPNPLYTSQIFIPEISSDEGPAAFGLAGRVHPSRWIVHYKGNVIAPDSGSFHFVGVADDVLVVRFNGNIVLDCSLDNPSGLRPHDAVQILRVRRQLQPSTAGSRVDGEGQLVSTSRRARRYPHGNRSLANSPAAQFCAFVACCEKVGVEYEQGFRRADPILPVLKFSHGPDAADRPEATYQRTDAPWSVWPATASTLESRRRPGVAAEKTHGRAFSHRFPPGSG